MARYFSLEDRPRRKYNDSLFFNSITKWLTNFITFMDTPIKNDKDDTIVLDFLKENNLYAKQYKELRAGWVLKRFECYAILNLEIEAKKLYRIT